MTRYRPAVRRCLRTGQRPGIPDDRPSRLRSGVMAPSSSLGSSACRPIPTYRPIAPLDRRLPRNGHRTTPPCGAPGHRRSWPPPAASVRRSPGGSNLPAPDRGISQQCRVPGAVAEQHRATPEQDDLRPRRVVHHGRECPWAGARARGLTPPACLPQPRITAHVSIGRSPEQHQRAVPKIVRKRMRVPGTGRRSRRGSRDHERGWTAFMPRSRQAHGRSCPDLRIRVTPLCLELLAGGAHATAVSNGSVGPRQAQQASGTLRPELECENELPGGVHGSAQLEQRLAQQFVRGLGRVGNLPSRSGAGLRVHGRSQRHQPRQRVAAAKVDHPTQLPLRDLELHRARPRRRGVVQQLIGCCLEHIPKLLRGAKPAGRDRRQPGREQLIAAGVRRARPVAGRPIVGLNGIPAEHLVDQRLRDSVEAVSRLSTRCSTLLASANRPCWVRAYGTQARAWKSRSPTSAGRPMESWLEIW